MSQEEEEIEKGFQQHFKDITTKKRKIEEQLFEDANVDPIAPINPEIDAEINEIARKKAATEKLHELLSQTKSIYTETTGKPAGGGKKRKTKRKKSKKSKKVKSKRRRYRK